MPHPSNINPMEDLPSRMIKLVVLIEVLIFGVSARHPGAIWLLSVVSSGCLECIRRESGCCLRVVSCRQGVVVSKQVGKVASVLLLSCHQCLQMLSVLGVSGGSLEGVWVLSKGSWVLSEG